MAHFDNISDILDLFVIHWDLYVNLPSFISNRPSLGIFYYHHDLGNFEMLCTSKFSLVIEFHLLG